MGAGEWPLPDVLFGRPMAKFMRRGLSSYTLALALGLSALAAGAIHLSILAAFAVLVIASALLASKEGPPSSVPWGSRELVCIGVWFCLAAFCLLQTVPLPLAWVQALAPDNADIWSRALRPWNLPEPALAHLSLAPGRSVIEALKAASYGLAFAVSFQLGHQGGLRQLAWLGFGAALVVGLVTAAHQISGAQHLYGTYRPIDAYDAAPLLNANNRAGYLNLGFFCGLGLLFRAGARPLAALIGSGLVLVAAEVLLCESVGGSGCLAIGLVLAAVLPRTRRSSHLELNRWLQGGIVIAIGLAAAAMAIAARRSTLGWSGQTFEKFQLFSKAWQLARDHFGFGVGRGAFGSVFAKYQDQSQQGISEHVENFPIQWAAEWGVPVTLIALVALSWSLWPICGRRTFSSPVRRCTLIGCLVLLLQNQVDLGLEIPAVAALLSSLLGALCGASARGAVPSRGLSSQAVLRMGSGLTAVCLVLALALGVEAPSRLRHQLHAELAATNGPPPTGFWTRLRSAMQAYPAEPYFPLLGSSAALAAGQPALPWIARALERSPTSAQAHLELARVLHAGGATSQALSALRESLELNPRSTVRVLQLGEAWGLSPEALESVAPAGSIGAPFLVLLASHAKDDQVRTHLLERAVEHDPGHADAHYQLALELLSSVRRQAEGACAAQPRECLLRAAEHARLGSRPGSSRTAILEARLLAERGQPQEAEELLAQACERLPGDLDVADALVNQALANDSPRLEGAVRSLVATACSNPERCGATHSSLGNRFANAGSWHLAVAHYQRAAEEAPSPAAWQALAGAADQLGLGTLAASARRRLALSRPATTEGAKNGDQ